MASNKTDPRVVKTRTNLRRALVQLMRREEIDNISVQKITETANITRGTFYLHYKDKHDFIESAFNGILDEFFGQVIIDSDRQRINGGKRVQVFALQRAFQYIESEADLFDVLLNGRQNNSFCDQLYNRLANRLVTYYHQTIDPHRPLTVPLNLQIAFISSAFLGLVSHWLQEGMIYTPRYMSQSVLQMLDQFNHDQVNLVGFFS